MQSPARRVRPVSKAAKLRVLGIDASMNSTGYAYYDGDTPYVGTIKAGKFRGPQRLSNAAYRMTELLEEVKPDAVLFEDYAFAGKGRIAQIGEMGGVLRMAVYRANPHTTIHSIPGTLLKKLITGKGVHKDKQVMIDHVCKVFGVSITQDDEADAFALLTVAEAFYNRSGPAELVVAVADAKPKIRLEWERT